MYTFPALPNLSFLICLVLCSRNDPVIFGLKLPVLEVVASPGFFLSPSSARLRSASSLQCI